MKLLDRILSRPIDWLVRLACFLALIGLFALSLSILWPKPLPVIFAMSGGHLIGILAFACYLLAVVQDAARLERARTETSQEESKSKPHAG